MTKPKVGSRMIAILSVVIAGVGVLSMFQDHYSRTEFSAPNMGIVVGNTAIVLVGALGLGIACCLMNLERRLDRPGREPNDDRSMKKVGMVGISLSPKDLHLVIPAIEFKLQWYEDQLKTVDDEDLRSEMVNDKGLLECILAELKTGLEDANRRIEKELSAWKSKHDRG